MDFRSGEGGPFGCSCLDGETGCWLPIALCALVLNPPDINANQLYIADRLCSLLQATAPYSKLLRDVPECDDGRDAPAAIGEA